MMKSYTALMYDVHSHSMNGLGKDLMSWMLEAKGLMLWWRAIWLSTEAFFCLLSFFFWILDVMQFLLLLFVIIVIIVIIVVVIIIDIMMMIIIIIIVLFPLMFPLKLEKERF